MTISKFKALEHAAREIKDNCKQYKDCIDCLFGKEYLVCPFKSSIHPCDWIFEKIYEEEGTVRHGKWIELPKALDPSERPVRCSVCNTVMSFYHGYTARYCSACGAKMDLEE